MCDAIHNVLGDGSVTCNVVGTPFLSAENHHWKCTESHYPPHMYYIVYSMYIGCQLMNAKLLGEFLYGGIAADSAMHDTPEIASSCNWKLDEVTYE